LFKEKATLTSSGWIDKFLMNKTFRKTFPKTTYTFIKKLEKQVLYMVISFHLITNAVETKGWFKEEISKVLNTLYGIFVLL
jgi:hypothetical protein